MQFPLRRLILTALLCLPAAVFAQYPDAPIRLNVGFPPGTGPDIVARTLSQQLGERLKQSGVVDNRAGAGAGVHHDALFQGRAEVQGGGEGEDVGPGGRGAGGVWAQGGGRYGS